MKLIVIIPAYNEENDIASVVREIPRSIPGISTVEALLMDDGSTDRTIERAKEAGVDHIETQKKNVGLAKSFADAVERALRLGADIIVNTDGDNHYDQSRIPELIRPILDKKADIVIGSRDISHLSKSMPWSNRIGNRVGSFLTCAIASLPPLDVSSGFRAYTRDAAMRLSVYSQHTYTHATLIAAADQKLAIAQVVIPARKVHRPSRLIQNLPRHIFRASIVIARNILLFKPLRSFSILGSAIAGLGGLLIIRYLYFYAVNGGRGHVQSLIIAGVLIIVGFQIGVLGIIASAVGWNRKILEDILVRIKKIELDRDE